MNYDDAINLIARGAAVRLSGLVVYMSVNFNSGTAGVLVKKDILNGESEYSPSDEDIKSQEWALYDPE
jgi:hypothetical protein